MPYWKLVAARRIVKLAPGLYKGLRAGCRAGPRPGPARVFLSDEASAIGRPDPPRCRHRCKLHETLTLTVIEQFVERLGGVGDLFFAIRRLRREHIEHALKSSDVVLLRTGARVPLPASPRRRRPGSLREAWRPSADSLAERPLPACLPSATALARLVGDVAQRGLKARPVLRPVRRSGELRT